MSRRFQLVDVFNEGTFSGNPLAVVFDAGDLTTVDMQRVARWLNLSETVFILPPGDSKADYRVRIFTVNRELPFAGHPTLGSCHAWLSAGGVPQSAAIVQECGAGLIPIRRVDDTLAFAAPPLVRTGPVEESKIQELAQFLRIERGKIIDAEWADNGPGWVAVLLDSAAEVLALKPASAHPGGLDLGVVGAYPRGGPVAFELRAFFSDQDGAIREDPVTGSLNASIAQWMLRSGRAQAPYTASQGSCLGRSGRVFISQDPQGAVWVGGRTATLFSGTGSF